MKGEILDSKLYRQYSMSLSQLISTVKVNKSEKFNYKKINFSLKKHQKVFNI